MQNYITDASANLSVTYPGGINTSCGCASIASFTPLSSSRFLAVHQAMSEIGMFDVMTGNQLSGRLIIADSVIGLSFLQPTQIDNSTITFGQSSGTLGKGALYFVKFPF